MADTTVIGRATFVRGRVNGSGDLEIAGRVEGDVTVTGDVTVEASGLVAANISARRIVVRGAVRIESGARVRGDISGEFSLEEGAEFVGNIASDFDMPAELGGTASAKRR